MIKVSYGCPFWSACFCLTCLFDLSPPNFNIIFNINISLTRLVPIAVWERFHAELIERTWTERYYTIEEFNVDSKAKCDQLNLARRQKQKRFKKEETKTNKRKCPLSSLQVVIRTID